MDQTALLAWRTIVTLLSLVHSNLKRDDTPKSKQNITRELKEELRLSDALAALCVRRNEVVAVVAKPDGSGNVRVIVSASFAPAKRPLNLSQSRSLPSKIWAFVGGFWLAQNPRANGPTTPSAMHSEVLPDPLSMPDSPDLPTLVDPEINVPQHLKVCISTDPSMANKLLEAFLIHEW